MEDAQCSASSCESKLSEKSNGAGNAFCRNTSPSTPVEGDVVYKIIAAIDFGTTFSGYAYAMASEKDSIFTNRNWGQTQGFLLQKTPTCLLLKPSGEFAAFGFDAVSQYNNLTENEASEHYFFDRFKMKLYDNKVRHRFLLRFLAHVCYLNNTKTSTFNNSVLLCLLFKNTMVHNTSIFTCVSRIIFRYVRF